jgi:hypothetical protein
MIDVPALALICINSIICLPSAPHDVLPDQHVPFIAAYWRHVVRTLQLQLCMSSVFHQEMDGLSDNLTKRVVLNLHVFTTPDQAKHADYLPLEVYAYNYSVPLSTKQMAFERNLG